jgi:hypothetical protein
VTETQQQQQQQQQPQGNIIQTTTMLSQARYTLTSTSASEIAFFAGGYSSKGLPMLLI